MAIASFGLGSGNYVNPARTGPISKGSTTQQRLEASQVNLARSADLQARWNLQQQQEAWDLKKKTAESSGKLASQFLSAWTSSIGQVGDFYQQMISGISSESGPMAGQMAKLNELTDYIGQEYETHKEQYGGMTEEFLQDAKAEASMRRQAGTELMGMSDPDYEGVSGRAAADVGAQSEAARQSQARQMMGMGVDPTSGRFGALNRRSYLDEAKNTAIAMIAARRGEKERAAGLKATTMGLLDPSRSAQVGINLNTQGQNLLNMQGGLAKAGVEAQTAQTKVLGDLAGGYAKNVTGPMGEMAGYFLGASGGMGLPSQIASYPTQQIPGQIQLPQAAL